MKSSQANRGMALENLIEQVNRIYEEKHIAFIQKIPTPVKVAKLEKGFIKHGWFEKKSTIDFIGVYQGRFIAFDCKSTKEKSFPLKNIEEHQMETLEKMRSQEGITFFLVQFVKTDELYVIRYEQVKYWYEAAKDGGRKSIPYKFFVDECVLVTENNDIPLDYLHFLNK